MSKVVDLRKTDDLRDVVHRAVQSLTAGQLVVFPTETVYVACAHSLVPDAVGRLAGLHADPAFSKPMLLLKGLQEAIDYFPAMDRLGRRLARRCWPGPVVLAFDVGNDEGLLRAMPPQTREALARDGELWLWVPSHECVQESLRLMPAPMLAQSALGKDGQSVTCAAPIVERYNEAVALIIDDGECRYAEPATVVRVANGSWSIRRPGVVTETMIRRLASEIFLFICTGNTCRSPLAEGFFRKLLADRLECAEDELADRGYLVLSAGMAADPGLPASPESVEIAQRYGVDLRNHESQQVTDRLLAQADRIFTMTSAHREAILSSFPQFGDRVELLARDHSDIPDPIGAGKQEYETCRTEIERHLRAVLKELPLSR